MKTILGVFFVAAVATTGDFIWYTFGVRHTVVAGLVHGALLLTAVGAVLGHASGHVLRGLPIGAIAGVSGAAIYALLVVVMDPRPYGSAIPTSWVVMWLILAALDGRWLRAPERRNWAAIAGRGLAAAAFGGVAFYLVMNTLWGRPPTGGRNYVVQLFAWAFAWAPGLVALTIGRAPAAAMSISGPELLERIDRGEALHILDVRSEGEFGAGHVPGAVNIPFTKVLTSTSAVPGAVGDEIILYCGHGPRAHIAGTSLRRGGRTRIVYLSGHWAGWQAAGLREEHERK